MGSFKRSMLMSRSQYSRQTSVCVSEKVQLQVDIEHRLSELSHWQEQSVSVLLVLRSWPNLLALPPLQ